MEENVGLGTKETRCAISSLIELSDNIIRRYGLFFGVEKGEVLLSRNP